MFRIYRLPLVCMHLNGYITPRWRDRDAQILFFFFFAKLQLHVTTTYKMSERGNSYCPNRKIGLKSRVAMFFTFFTSETSKKNVQRFLDSPILRMKEWIFCHRLRENEITIYDVLVDEK